jgi:hypothetical protein
LIQLFNFFRIFSLAAAKAETVKFRIFTYVIRMESMPIGFVDAPTNILMCTTKQAGELLVFTCIVNFVFSLPVYANDDIELAGDIIRVILPLTAAGMTIFQNFVKRKSLTVVYSLYGISLKFREHTGPRRFSPPVVFCSLIFLFG